MFISLRRFVPIAALGLFLAAAWSEQAEAQPRPSGFNAQSWAAINRVNPNPTIAPGLTLNQAAYNTSVLGRAYSHVPPYALGYNPYSARAGYGYQGPAIAPSFVAPDTAPPVGGYGISSGYGAPISGYGGYGSVGYGLGTGLGNALAGQASVISATGDYYQSTMQARITREQARQAAVKTRKMQYQEQLEYERMQPTAIDVRNRTRSIDLNWARSGPPDNEIWSGRMLNVLLQSCLLNPSLGGGPHVPLDESVLSRINIKDKNQRGNIGLLKESKLHWPVGLQEEVFDELRDRLSKNLKVAATQIGSGDQPDIKTMRALRADQKAMVEKIDSGIEGLSPSEFIRSKRYLNKLKDTITALTEPTVGASIDLSWTRSVSNVGDLVNYMKNKGLEFAGAAAPDSYAAYSSFYYSLRQFELGLNVARK